MLSKPVYTFNKEKHEHFLNGVRIPGVTSILTSEGFINYPKADFMRDALYRGNYVHVACEYFNQGRLNYETLLPEFKGYVDAWIKYCDKEKPNFQTALSEYCVYSGRWRFAGVVDFLYQERLIDLKTSAKEQPAWKYQTAGYKLAIDEMSGLKVKERLVVQLKKTGDYKIFEHKDKTDTQNFLTILTCYKLKEKDGLLNPQGDEYYE